MNYEFDHVGIAVRSLDQALVPYRAFGWQNFHIEEVPSEKVRVAFVTLKNQSNIELLEPTSRDSVIAKFIEKRGEGIHHICLRVQNIENVIAELKNKGLQMIDQTPRAGAHGCKVAFIHPKSMNGMLVELSEKVKHAQ